MADIAASADRAPETAKAAYSPAYSAYITFVLALVFMLAAADRNIMSILLVPIQKELAVSDAAMGALTGLAFSLVYATAAIPLARIADRGRRRNLVAAAVTLWSAMTALCGLATSYATLLLARVGVAAGEAAHQPAILSMATDLHPPRRRGIAIGCIAVGSSVGIALGAYLAGLLSDLYGWRVAFLALGVPGLVVGALVMFTLPEPARGAFEGGARPEPAHASVWRSFAYLAGVQTVRRLLLAKVLNQLGIQGFLVWTPAFFMRVHDMSTTEMSALFGLSVGIGGVLSQLVAGGVSDWLCKRGERFRSYYCAGALIGGVPCVLMIIFGPTPVAMAGMFLVAIITGGATTASLTAGLGVVRGSMRGFMTAVMLFCTMVIGGGLGPVVLGAVNDALKVTLGDESLRYTLIFVPVLYALSGVVFWFAARTTDRDAAAALARAADGP